MDLDLDMEEGMGDDSLPAKRQSKEAADPPPLKRHKEEEGDDDHHHQVQEEGDSDTKMKEGSSPSSSSSSSTSEGENKKTASLGWSSDGELAQFAEYAPREIEEDDDDAAFTPVERDPLWEALPPHDYDYGYEDATNAKATKGEMDVVDDIDSLLSVFEQPQADEGKHEATWPAPCILIPCCWDGLLPPAGGTGNRNVPISLPTENAPPSYDGFKSYTEFEWHREKILGDHLLELSLTRTRDMYTDLQSAGRVPEDLQAVNLDNVAHRLWDLAGNTYIGDPNYAELRALWDNLEFSIWYPRNGPLYAYLELHRYRKTGRRSRFSTDRFDKLEEEDKQFVKLYDDLLAEVERHPNPNPNPNPTLKKKDRLEIVDKMRNLGKKYMEEQKLSFDDTVQALIYAKRYAWSSQLAAERFRLKRYLYQQYEKGKEYAHREPLLEKLRLIERELILKWEIPIPRLLGDFETFSENVRSYKLHPDAKNEIFREYRLTLATIDSLLQVHHVEHIRRKLEVADELGILNVSCEELYNKLPRGSGSGSDAGGIKVDGRTTTEVI